MKWLASLEWIWEEGSHLRSYLRRYGYLRLTGILTPYHSGEVRFGLAIIVMFAIVFRHWIILLFQDVIGYRLSANHNSTTTFATYSIVKVR